MEQKFDVMGMTCASCQAHVDKSVRNLKGVNDVNVNLLSENMVVNYDENVCSVDEIIAAVRSGGYDAALKGEKAAAVSQKDDDLKKRYHSLLASFAFMIPLFYLSMGSMMKWPGIPSIFLGHENMMIFALTELLLCLPVLIINAHYFTGGFKALVHRAPNMDSLIALGSGASVVYSLYGMYMMAYYLGRNNLEMAHSFHMNLYFESAAMILTLISLGKYFEARSKKKTSDAINALRDLAPSDATVLVDGVERTVAIDAIHPGDLVVVKTGESIPVDGEIVEGLTSVDESMITGESIPVDKKPGDLVIGSTINVSGRMVVKTLKANDQSTLSQIIALVEEAGNSKAPIARLADVISGYFVPFVIGIALLALVLWLTAGGQTLHFALTMAISVLVISCPCALGLATPTAIMVASGQAARMGLLIKNAEALEVASHLTMIVFDKTGTLTKGQPEVTDVECFDERMMAYGIALEAQSSHPLAQAILRYQSAPSLTVEDYTEIPGEGLRGMIAGHEVLAGNMKLMAHYHVAVSEHVDYAAQGKTQLYFAIDGQYAGLIALSDAIKPEARYVIEELSKRQIKTMMLTGDHETTAKAIADDLGMSYRADVLPQDKQQVIAELADEGHIVGMVGDGINDAPALMKAHLGISFTSGLDIAIDSSDIVLMKNDLQDLIAAIDLSHATIKNIKQNLFWALFYNAICIPIAAGLFYNSLHLKLSPMLGSLAMSFSSVFVVTNALRLRFFKYEHADIKSAQEDQKEKIQEDVFVIPEEKAAGHEEDCDVVIDIEGMMCEHCVKRVKEALEALPVKADVSLADHKAYVCYREDVSKESLAQAVKDAGYEVKEIKEMLFKKKVKKEMMIEGMMCPHCAARVEKALNDINGVEAKVVLDEHKALLTLDPNVDEDALTSAVTNAGYQVTGIR